MTFIAGFLLSRPQPDAAPRAIASAMLQAGLPRGNDDSGLWADADGQIAMASRMHRTRDLTPDGAQPFVSQCRRMAVMLDGHVANAPVLRRELEEAGRRFRGHGDAELVAEGAVHWGLNRLLQKLEGAFALALWDTRDRALHLVRDRMGARPLYAMACAGAQNGAAFASDPRAFRALPDYVPAIDPGAAAQYLAWGLVCPPASLWQGVLCLPPAHRLMLRAGDTALPAPEAYWSPATTLEEIALRDAKAQPAAVRLDRLSRHLCAEAAQADVPFAMLDDGGAAAAVLRANLTRAAEKPFKSFALAQPDGMGVQTAFDALSRLPEPVCNPAAAAWYGTLKRAAADAPVCMAACTLTPPADGDEPHARLRPLLLRLPRFLHRLVPRHLAHLRSQPAAAWAQRAAIWPAASPVPDVAEPRMESPLAARVAFHDFVLGFCAAAMPSLDRVAHAAGVELRLPLANARILEYGLPGAPAPDYAQAAIWLRGPLRPRVQDLVASPALFARLGIDDPAPYAGAWRAFLDGDTALTPRVWALATLLAWTKAAS